MRKLVLALLIVACRSHDEPRPSPKVGSAMTPASDPWMVKADKDAPPSLAERHAHVEKACPRVTAPYFFSIEKAGKTSYILGTRHISVGLAKFPQVVRDRLHGAKLVVFEVAPGDDAHPEHPDVALATELGPDVWKHYVELVGRGVAGTLERGQPPAALLVMMAEYEDIGAMLESEIERDIAATKTPARGLETAMFQDELLEKLLDVRMLRATIAHTKDRKQLEDESTKDLQQYCGGTDESPGMDDDTRAELLAGGYTAAEIDSIDEQMVYARNRSWIPKLEELFASGDVFVAVGADHLIGDKGVVALLRKRGFTVTRIAS